MKIRAGHAVVVSLLSAGVVALAATPAMAHDPERRWRGVEAAVFHTADHRMIQVCDVDADNAKARAWYIDERNVHRVIEDPDNSGGRCGNGLLESRSNSITYFRECRVLRNVETCNPNWKEV